MSSHRDHARDRNHRQFSNAHFERYYRHQLFSSSASKVNDDRGGGGGDKSETNLRSLLQTLSRPLPLTFRVTRNDHAEITLNAMRRAIEMESSSFNDNNRTTTPPPPPRLREISFLNDERTFQIDNVSVNESDDLKTKHPSLHEFLTRANEGGDLSRCGGARLRRGFCECYSLSLSLSFCLCVCVCVDARFLLILMHSHHHSFIHIPQARTRLDDPGQAFRRAAAPFSSRFVRLARVENVANIRSHAE